MKKIVLLIFFIGTIAATGYCQKDDTKTNPQPSNAEKAEKKDRRKQQPTDCDSIRVYRDSIISLNNNAAHLNGIISQKDKEINTKNEEIKTLTAKLGEQTKKCNEMTAMMAKIDLYNHIDSVNDSSKGFFCRAVMELPLFSRYDQDNISFSLEMAKTMGYSNKKNQYNWIYAIYSESLKNYETYNKETIKILDLFINKFDEPNKPVRNIAREMFENKFKDCSYIKYLKKYEKDEYYKFRHIYYLDYTISDIKKLFESDDTFTKENFIKLRERLEPLPKKKEISKPIMDTNKKKSR